VRHNRKVLWFTIHLFRPVSCGTRQSP
jgi:hypothetical protein